MGADKYFDCCREIRLDLLELIGKEYIFEHCISELKLRNELDLFRNYIAMSLYAISNNRGMTKTYQEIQRASMEKKDSRSGDEIAIDVIKKAGLVVAKG